MDLLVYWPEWLFAPATASHDVSPVTPDDEPISAFFRISTSLVCQTETGDLIDSPAKSRPADAFAPTFNGPGP